MRDDLVKQISYTIGKPKILTLSTLFAAQHITPNELIDITFHADNGIAFRAGWILENMFLQRPEWFLPALHGFISKIKLIQNPGCKRHYAKILMHLTGSRMPLVIQEQIGKTDLEPVVEQCFDWLIDPEILVAVKAFAAEVLYNLRHRYPWIVDELNDQLQYLMRDGTAAIQSKGKRLLAGLKTV